MVGGSCAAPSPVYQHLAETLAGAYQTAALDRDPKISSLVFDNVKIQAACGAYLSNRVRLEAQETPRVPPRARRAPNASWDST